jgi:hypothetical protein
MNVDSARVWDAIVYDLVLTEFRRGQNRARIANLANGVPPYTPEEVEENGISVNINDLTHTTKMHDARTQFYNGFLKTGFFAQARTDWGPAHKRQQYSSIVTKEWNKLMKRSVAYFERLRAEFGLLVLHGISPAVFQTEYKWCPKPLGVEDILLPGETLLGFENLPFIVIRRDLTAIELEKLTGAETRDPGWNMPFVQRILEWMHTQATVLRAMNWPDVWAPEKIAERSKAQGGGYLAGDRAPRITVFDIYAYDDRENEEGWIRRMILDAWSEPAIKGSSSSNPTRKDGVEGDTTNFLFTSNKRKVAQTWQNITSFQFADLSAVFPARYHSVRGLGWLLYASCHLSSRLRCKFYESVLEALMQYYEVNDQSDVQNALRLNLINRGFIDKTIRPVKAQDRWQVNAGLVELGLRDNQQVIGQNSAAYTQNQNLMSDNTEKTRFQYMAELQAATSLVGSALNQAYMYQNFEHREIFRRFTLENSKDPDVRAFQAACLKQNIPAKLLYDQCAWEVETERVTGAGNKTLEMTIAQQLMEWRPLFDPEPQRDILRNGVLAITDDAALSTRLVPEQPNKVTPAVHDAELTAATLMAGIPVQVMTGINHIETIETLLQILEMKVQLGMQSGMVSPEVLLGMQNMMQHIAQHIQIVAQNKAERARVKQYGDRLGQLGNLIKAFQQRLQEHMQEQAQGAAGGNGGLDPKDAARITATMEEKKAKLQNMSESHAQRTAQRAIQFEQQLKMDQAKHRAELEATHMDTLAGIHRDNLVTHADQQAANIETAAGIHRDNALARAEMDRPKPKAKDAE